MDFLKILGKNAWEYVKYIPFFLFLGLILLVIFAIAVFLTMAIPIAIFNLFINLGILNENNPNPNTFLIFTVWISLLVSLCFSLGDLDTRKPLFTKFMTVISTVLSFLVVVNVPIVLLVNLIPISPLSSLSTDNQFLIGLIIYFLFMGMVYLLSKLIEDTKKEYDRRG
ncbi:hypothetical protein [Staphylococcus phage vB_SsapH-Golestan-100]|nr:hypothetical protein [Staphylococcus phage vB_SsapH-Golestan-100]